MKHLLVLIMASVFFAVGCDDNDESDVQQIYKNDCEDPVIDTCGDVTLIDCSTVQRSGPFLYKDNESGVIFCECMTRNECTATLHVAHCPPDWTCIK